MKKFFSMVATIATAALALTSCNDSNNDPQEFDVLVSTGAFIVNSGNVSKGVDGSLSFYDYTNQTTSQNVYRSKNGVSLGGTVNDAIVHGSKLYIVGSGEKTIFVANAKTIEKIINIPTGEYTPRHIAAYGDKVYVSTYNNKVLAIDTLTCTVQKTYDCGNYSEGIKAIGKYVFTADSNYGSGKDGASITVIDTEEGSSNSYKNDNIVNPTEILTFVDDYGYLHIYYVDSGSYDANWNQSGQGVYEFFTNGTSKKIVEATMAAVGTNGCMYTINAPYTYPATEPTYKIIDLSTGYISSFTDGKDIASPAAIAVDGTDPYNNLVFITSYNMVDGYASYSTPGYAMIYKGNTGAKISKIDTGVGPTSLCFNYHIEKVIIK